MIRMKKTTLLFVSSLFITVLCTSSCQTVSSGTTLYEQLGGEAGVAHIVDNFITEISFDPVIFKHFEESDQQRFRTKLIEQVCEISNGPCRYTGDSMQDTHKKMHITESEFNRTVDLLINAMNKAKVPHTAQNRLLARLKELRQDIIYR